MSQRLNNDNYEESDMITIRMPISIPYAVDSYDFERTDGMIEHNGTVYRKVKQRLLKDTLQIVCVKDHHRERINKAFISFVKTFSDQDNALPSGKVIHEFAKDYLPCSIAISRISAGWYLNQERDSRVIFSISEYHPSVIYPPEIPSKS